MRRRLPPVALALVFLACGGKVDRDGIQGDGGGGAASSGGAGGSLGGGGAGGSGASPACTQDYESDPEHCGYCYHSCQGGECIDSRCQPVVLRYLGNEGATALALDEETIWWASPVRRMPKDGGTPETFAQTKADVWGIAADATDVYWTSWSGALWRISKAGGTAVELGTGGYRIALDDSFVYTVWKGVWRLPKSGGDATYLANIGEQGIALDDGFVYFTTWTDGGVWKVPKTGGVDPVLLGKADSSSYVAVYGDTVYWSSQGSSQGIRAVPKSGGETQVIASAATPYGIAADAGGVYWAEFSGGSIWMLATGTSTPVLLASGQFYPRDLAVDGTAVYWTNDASQSAVSKVVKP